MVISATGTSGISNAVSIQPSPLDVIPESAIRKYRAPYYGERESSRINVQMQAIQSDIKLIYTKIVEADENIDKLLSLCSYTNFTAI